MTVCERIDMLLQQKNMSRRQLAIKAGIAPSSLQSAMQRNKGLSLDMLFPVSEVLGVDVEFLSTGEFASDPLPKEERERLDELAAQRSEEYQRYLKTAVPFTPIWLNWDKLNKSGQLVAIERFMELTQIPKYQRTYSENPEKFNAGAHEGEKQGDLSTKQEKPSQGEFKPNDGKA